MVLGRGASFSSQVRAPSPGMLGARMAAQTVDVDQLAEAIDTSGVSGWDVLIAFGIVLGTLILAAITRRVIIRLCRPLTIPAYVGPLLGRISYYVVLVVGLAAALQRVGVAVGPLLASLGFVLIIVAFAARPLLENFGSGLVIEARGPFRPGDQISTNGHDGTVSEINARSVILVTQDGERVHIPNASVLREPLVNHTVLGGKRSTLHIGLAYDSDLTAAKRVALGALVGVDGVRSDPTPEAYIDEFDDSTITMAVRFWHDPRFVDGWMARDAAASAVRRGLAAGGIEIAFPQRTLWWGGAKGPREERLPGSNSPAG